MIKKDMRYKEFYGYKFYEDGTVINKHGKEIKKSIINGVYYISLNINKKRKTFIFSRLLYHLFYPFDIENKNLCVSFKDRNPYNIHLNNLYLTDKKEVIKRRKLTDKQIKEIRLLYKGKSGKNQYCKKGYSLNDLAKMYGVSKSTIQQIVNKKN